MHLATRFCLLYFIMQERSSKYFPFLTIFWLDWPFLPKYNEIMQNRSRKNQQDINQLAKSIVDEVTMEELIKKATEEGKNPAAVMLGRLGGLKGGKARAKKLSAEKRKEIAKKAAQTRWNTK